MKNKIILWIFLFAAISDTVLIHWVVDIRLFHFYILINVIPYLCNARSLSGVLKDIMAYQWLSFFVLIILSYLIHDKENSLFIERLITIFIFFASYKFQRRKFQQMTEKSVIAIFRHMYLLLVFSLSLDFLSQILGVSSLFTIFSNHSSEYKYGELFSNDSNWSFLLLSLLGSLLLFRDKSSKFNRLILYGILQFILILLFERRANLIIISLVLFYYISSNTELALSRIFRFTTYLLSPVVIFLLLNSNSFLDEDLTDLNRNPRLNDWNGIYRALEENNMLVTGAGFGRLNEVAYYLTWREKTHVSNILLLNVFGELGYSGLLYVLLILLREVPRFKGELRIILLSLLVFAFFHFFFFRFTVVLVAAAIGYFYPPEIHNKLERYN